MIPWWSTDFGEPEIAAVSDAIRNRCISQGRITRQFEEELAERLGVPYVVCTTSGTTALTIALLAAGIKPGDEVIVPNRTWIATAHAVMLCGAKPVLVDVEPYVPVIDAELIEAKITPRTRAIIPVHLNGRVPNLPTILEIARRHDLRVIEDTAQAFPNAPAGDAACYSLSTAKIIATGQGGFVATRSQALYDELRALRTHDVADAMVPAVLTWRRFGYNFRYTDLQAAIGLEQLKRLEPRIQRCRELYSTYRDNLPPYLELLPVAGYSVPLYIEVISRMDKTVQPHESERMRTYLHKRGIEARPFYPSLHTAPYLADGNIYPRSERYSSGLILPCGPAQTTETARQVCGVLNYYDFDPG